MIVLVVLLVAGIFAYHIVTDPNRRRRGQTDGTAPPSARETNT